MTCPTCDGTGFFGDDECSMCSGLGYIDHRHPATKVRRVEKYPMCPQCVSLNTRDLLTEGSLARDFECQDCAHRFTMAAASTKGPEQ